MTNVAINAAEYKNGLNTRNKTVVIFEHDGGQLANQLWNFVSIMAYCHEKGYGCKNYSFYKYAKLFRGRTGNFFDFLFLNLPHWVQNRLYKIYILYVWRFKKPMIVSARMLPNKEIADFYLSPSPFKSKADEITIDEQEASNASHIYCTGWLFRNPVGIEKFRKQIIQYFRPPEKTVRIAIDLLNEIHSKHKKIIGVHIRQTDYRQFDGGRYFFSHEEVRKILDDYLESTKQTPSSVGFLLCSDEVIPHTIYAGLNTYRTKGDVIGDLFSLSLCDAIIGSNSTFSAFSAYYGNIPMVLFSRDKIDWVPIAYA